MCAHLFLVSGVATSCVFEYRRSHETVYVDVSIVILSSSPSLLLFIFTSVLCLHLHSDLHVRDYPCRY